MPLIEARGLTKIYRQAPGLLARGRAVRAVDDVSFAVEPGETFGLVGESGSGKTTTGRCLLRLVEPTAGRVHFRDRDLTALSAADLRRERRHMQMVFQDPFSSLTPRLRVGELVGEALAVHGLGTARERAERVAALLRMVGLDPADAARLPRELSGGQRQRVGIARALATQPALLVADEPVASLDVSVQAQIANLLLDLQEQLGLTMIFISHDLRLVRHLCARVAVMLRGRIVEMGPAPAVWTSPRHGYTRALLEAVRAPGEPARPSAPWAADTGDDVSLREVAPGHWARVR